jgi:hypothetical protein
MLKNYRSEMPVSRIFESLTKLLVSHGARQITFDYDSDGRAVGLAFTIETPQGTLPIKLPARAEKVGKVMERQRAEGWTKPEQHYRTAWKNIHDWVAAQMALLETEMVKLEEIFLPYLVDHTGKTFFESVEQRGFLLTAAPDETSAV